jgi:hypothetical protein
MMRLYVRYYNGELEEYRDVRYASAYPNKDSNDTPSLLRIEFNNPHKDSTSLELKGVLNFWLTVDTEE